MAHLTQSMIAIQAVCRPFVCNQCRLAIASTQKSVKFQRRGLRRRANNQSRPAAEAGVVLETRAKDGAAAPDIENAQVLYRPLTASAEDGHSATHSSHFTTYTKPEVVNRAQNEDEESDLRGLGEDVSIYEEGGYVPAASWEGLKSFKPSEWDAQAQYAAFKPRIIMQEPTDVERAVHTSLVEIFALRQEGRPIDSIYNTWESVLDYDDLAANTTSFQTETDGGLTLRFASEGKRLVTMRKLVKDDTIGSESTEGAATAAHELGKEVPTPEHHEPLKGVEAAAEAKGSRMDKSHNSEGAISQDGAQDLAMLDESWKDVPLTDSAIKFAVMKRASQMLGLRIHDPDIMKINDTAGLMQLLTKKPKPKRLQEQIGKDDRLNGLLNLEIFGKRWTLHHKDIELGREKLIKEELISRGLAKSTHQPLRR